MSNTKENDHFMSHPELEDILGVSLSEMWTESDRGAVLIAAEVIISALKNLFDKILPDEYGKKKREEILSYPSPLGTFSAQTNIAYAVQIIDKQTHRSISLLRKIRNDAAHTNKKFVLTDHSNKLRELLEIGQGGYIYATSSAYEILTKNVYENVLSNELLRKTIDKEHLTSWKEFLFYISDNEDFKDKIENEAPRVSLSIGVSILCGLILLQRDKYLEKINSE